MRNALHQAAVAAEGVGAVVHHRVLRGVELDGQQAFGQGHAHSRGNALAQRAGGHFHTGGQATLGMARRLRAPLAEILDFLNGEIIAREMEHRVLEHGGMPVGQHEAVAVQPAGIGGIVLETVPPEGLGHVGHAEGSAGVAGAGFFNGVNGKSADGVGTLSAGGHDSFSFLGVMGWNAARQAARRGRRADRDARRAP